MKQKGTGREVIQIFQSGPQDNGQTALAMVLTSLGRPASPWELDAVENAADLVTQARANGLYAEGCRMTVRELCGAPLPAIVHWRFCSFVVVSRVRGRRVWVNDPEEGLRVMTLREFEAGFTGVAVCFAGQGGQRQEQRPPRARGVFARFPAASVLAGIAQAFISVCCTAAVMSLRLFAGSVSGAGGAGHDAAALFLASIMLLLAAVLFQGLLLRRCERVLRGQISQECARELEKRNPLFFRRVQAYQVSYACESCGTAGQAAVELMLHTMQLWTSAVCLALMAIQDIWAGAVAAFAAALFALAVNGQRALLCSEAKEMGRSRFRLNQQTAERLDGLDDLKGEHRRNFEQWLYAAGGQTGGGPARRLTWYWAVFAAVELAAVLCLCLLRTAEGRIELDEAAGCMGAALFFAGTMGALPRRVERQAALQAIRDTFEGLFRENGVQKAAGSGQAAPEYVEELTVQNVCLPPSRECTAGLQGISLSIRRGEVLSVEMDTGRLALSRMIAGIAAPAQGGIYIGGVDIRTLREEEIYRCVTLLGRGVPLPHGTVRENIAAGCGDISDFAVVQAADHAMLHEQMLLRERGYDTPAVELSTGEQVLLEFACAFARGTPFLVADACVERLDAGTVRALLTAARGRGVGTVLLTDRKSPCPWTDVVCRIEGGRVTLLERAEIVDWEGQGLVQST